jgi:hypothetical protein
MKMAKRFTDTQIWEKEWFMSLTPKDKCLVKYVRDKCDIAGIWSPNYLLASFYIGEKVTEQDLLNIDNGKQFQVLNDGKVICIDFIKFQYGPSLNPSSPIHKKVIDILEKYQIEFGIANGKSTRFQPPKLEEVFEEFKTKVSENQASIESKKFISYYESNGWKVGKNPMKSWKSAVMNWVSRIKVEKTAPDIKQKLQSLKGKTYSEL